jgi:superfamily II DNA or RNA helicase
MIELHVGNRWSRVIGELPDTVQWKLVQRMKYLKKNFHQMPSYQNMDEDGNRKWDGNIRLYKRDEPVFTGLLSYIRKTLDEFKIEYCIVDHRERVFENAPDMILDPPAKYVPRDYQEFTVHRAVEFTRGIIQVATGGGKTFMVTWLIGLLKVKPFIFYVLTKDLMYQAHSTLAECLQTPIGLVGDGKCEIYDVNVVMVQSAVRCLHKNDAKFNPKSYRFDQEDVWDDKEIFQEPDANRVLELLETASGIYFDEVHHAAALTCQEVLNASPNAYWRYGGSATPERDDGEDMVIQGLFGKRIVNISAGYLIKREFLVPCHIFCTHLEADSGGFTKYPQIYKHCVSGNEDFDRDIAETVDFLVKRGKICLVLVQHISHGKKLNKLIKDSEFLTGKDSSKKRKRIIEAARNREIQVVIATTLADEGLDIKPIDAVFMVGGGSSVTRVPQRVGRCLRTSERKEIGMFFYFRFPVKYLLQQAQKVHRVLSAEEEFKMHRSHGFDELRREIALVLNTKQKGLFQ